MAKISEEKYLALKQEAHTAFKKLGLAKLNQVEKEEAINANVNSRKFDNNEIKEIYIINLFIPDDKHFTEIYLNNKKNLAKTAQILKMPEDLVRRKVIELNIYGPYICNNNKEKSAEVEIIGDVIIDDNKEIIDDSIKTLRSQVASTIEVNRQKDAIIKKSEETINNQNEEIDRLRYQLTEYNDSTKAREVEFNNREKLFEMELNNRDQKFKDIEEKYKQLQDEHNDVREENSLLRVEITKLKRQLSSCKDEILQITSILDEIGLTSEKSI